MALICPPIIHCLADPEPASFHDSVEVDESQTFAVNMAFEVPAEQQAVGKDAIEAETALDEKDAEARLDKILAKLKQVVFKVYELLPPAVEGGPYQLVPAPGVLKATVSVPYNENQAALGYVHKWLKEQQPLNEPSKNARYWTTLAPAKERPDLEIDAEHAGASPRLRGAQAWNAPAGHRQGLTNLVRLTPFAADTKYVVLPFLADPGDAIPTDVGIVPKPKDGVKPDWPNVAVECTYDVLGGLGTWRCRTNPIGRIGAEPITAPPAVAPLDEMLTQDGFLHVNGEAEEIRRFLKTFEERAASIMKAGAPLYVEGKADADELEKIFGFEFEGDDVGNTVEDDKRTYRWGHAVWYVMVRLVAALDNHVLALLKPVAVNDPVPIAAGQMWKPDPNSEGDVLAPLVTLILAEVEELRDSGIELPDFDGLEVADKIRTVLQRNCPLVAANSHGSLLVPALRHIYSIAPPPTINVKDQPDQLVEPTNEAGLINIMLQTLKNEVDPIAKKYARQLENKSVQALDGALIDLEQPLYEESGAERALLRLLETVELAIADQDDAAANAKKRLPYLIAATLSDVVLPDEPDANLVTAIASAWAKYKALLEGPFNGAEAIRRAVGAAFTDALLKEAKESLSKLTVERLRHLAWRGSFSVRRLLDFNTQGTFLPLATALVAIPRPADWKMASFIRRCIVDYRRAIAPLITSPDKAARFIPDSFPQPLPIQIASGLDGSYIDDFAKAYNGICIAIRRHDEADKDAARWAYANLADLRWGAKPKPKGEVPEPGDELESEIPLQATGALHPMLPAIADGRGPMFIDYEGFPFADAAIHQRFAADVGRDPRTPFGTHEPHDFATADADPKALKFEPLPRLAYGRRFGTFSFAVSNAGTLPKSLQKSVDEPWMPLAQIDAAAIPAANIYTTVYQRRTAIARMAVIEKPDTGMSRRLGESIPGVQPLCADYPRLVMVAGPGLPGVMDLFRDSDGAPRMQFPAVVDRKIEWVLKDLIWAGSPTGLTFKLFDRFPDDPTQGGKSSTPSEGEVALASVSELKLTLDDSGVQRVLRINSNDTQLATIAGLDKAEAMYWLRIELTAGPDAKGGATLTSLSFADPESKRPAGDAAPLVLLRPDDATWRQNLPKLIKVTVSTPRVSYLDFMRWMANADLRKDIYNGTGADDFQKALFAAYFMRHLDAELARLLDNMPDPAVNGVRIEAAESDSLANPTLKKPLDTVYQIGKTAAASSRLQVFVDSVKRPDEGWNPLNLKIMLRALDKAFSFELTLSEGKGFGFALGDTSGQATVASGSVVQVSMFTLVPARHFEGELAAMHGGLKQNATRRAGAGNDDMLYFPATALRIETLYDGIGEVKPGQDPENWIEAAEKMIAVERVANVRRFDLKTKSEMARTNRNEWRLISEIDTATQRWRPTGRPIYHFIKPPRSAAQGNRPGSPVSPIALNGEVAQFESEAFFDRPDIDAQTVTQRLAPLGGRTTLQEFPWDPPSATYFRHRFTLRSRYAGALLSEAKRSVDAFPKSKEKRKWKEEGWTKRVAMLADASRLILTRPQLRALIPLTTAPGGEDVAAPTPPVAAILQEPPYSRGGLADRIAPELKTGFGYGFEKGKIDDNDETEMPPVEILDSRKEIGPNPQLTYRPFDHQEVLGLSLRGEGPLGLTFDMPDTPAPAFANTMLSLRPVSLTGSEPRFEEALMGVAMRRYLDPDWLAEPATRVDASEPKKSSEAGTISLRADLTWWVDIGTELVEITGLAETGALVRVADVLKPDIADADLGVVVHKETIDKVKGYNDLVTLVAAVESQRNDGLALLHQPIAPGRNSMSIFAYPSSTNVARGDGAQPFMLASFEWSMPVAEVDEGGEGGGGKADQPPLPPAMLRISGRRITARETMASATTSLQWTQISRDFDYVAIAGEQEPRLARNFMARLMGDTLAFDLIKGRTDVTLRASTLNNPYPSHVHRHIAFITSRYMRELGRPVEQFCRKGLGGGPTSTLFGMKKEPEQAVRVVEFETPASILCAADLTAPETYKRAYFDLVSTGYKENNILLLTIRFAGSQAHLSQFTSVTVTLDLPGAKSASIAIALKQSKTAWPVGARILLRPSGGEIACEAWTVGSDGKETPEPTKTIDEALNAPWRYPGFSLRLDAKAQGGVTPEFWTDVSLLHWAGSGDTAVAANLAIDFNFDWLFGQEGGSGEPALQVGPARLAGMVEAQARIISVSPPIRIV
ncbi:hypothetical protein [Mesorhizobium sp.]|uniref:hypothetical protein n=1 Tax=Mesorhizobium sp. TaxID=1871066 RepID=UPI00121685E6|nr:hypothetical protein [Mesorhizobium sp.]TIM05518.1 MAG: hypothetical protein E5Y62_27405 [Mesorhizobium sp.]